MSLYYIVMSLHRRMLYLKTEIRSSVFPFSFSLSLSSSLHPVSRCSPSSRTCRSNKLCSILRDQTVELAWRASWTFLPRMRQLLVADRWRTDTNRKRSRPQAVRNVVSSRLRRFSAFHAIGIRDGLAAGDRVYRYLDLRRCSILLVLN